MASITPRAGKWRVRIVRVGSPVITKTFITRRDAEKWARLTESELERGLYVCPAEAQRTTLDAALTRYENEVSKLKKSHCVEKYYIQHWRNSRLGAVALSAIRGSDVAQYRDQRLKGGLSPTSVRHELALLSHLFSVAQREWGMESLGNPVKSIRQPSFARGRERRVSAGEIDAICDEADAELSVLIRLAVQTAMRRGELVTMRWCDIDLVSGVARLQDTKNGDNRAVPLSSEAKLLLASLPRRINGRVFGLAADAVSHRFLAAVRLARKKYVEAGGMQSVHLTNLHFHDLRHEATSRLFELGMNTMEVAAITGHKTLSMLQRYTHLRAEDLARKLG